MLQRWIPALGWIKTYKKADLSGDISAGLTVAVMLIPQGMAYALLSGLPPVIGLYAVTIPLIVYSLFGSSRQLAVGPVAMMSLLTISGVSRLAEPQSPEFIAYVLLLSLMVGVMQFLLGLLRLGFIVNFLSHAVISGFTSAAAIVIGLSQLGHLLGVRIRGETVLEILHQAAQQVSNTNPVTLILGLVSIGLLLLFKQRLPRFPVPLLVVGVGTLLVALTGLDQTAGVKIVGQVPGGLPSSSLPAFSLESVRVLLPTALTATFVGFMESFAVARSIAAKDGYKVDANQELRGLGLANIAGSFFSASPVTGGFSRTAVNYQAGARTNLASLITAIMMILVLLFLTPLFYHLPNAILAAIVMVAVYTLINLKEPVNLWRIRKIDAVTLLITFAVTLTVSIEAGILAGAGFSLLVFIWQSAYPHMAELGYLEQEGVFRNVRRYPEVRTFPEALLFRIDAPLFFANLSFVEERIRSAAAARPNLRWILLDLSGVNDLDAVAIHDLERLISEFGTRGVRILFAGMKGPVRDLVRRAGWHDRFGAGIDYLSLRHALKAIGLMRGPLDETA